MIKKKLASGKRLNATELKKLATDKVKQVGSKCTVCQLDIVAEINKCLTDRVSVIGLERALKENGYVTVTRSKLQHHRDTHIKK
jgi:hypothetical protein